MICCDVLIVGGGPAGSSCAWQLTLLGLKVIVLDRSLFPRDKVCAGWITPQIVDSLQLDLADYRRERTLQAIDGFSCGLVDGPSVAVTYSEPISYAIRRCEFDDYLLRRSRAELRLGETLESLQQCPDGWIANQSIHCQLLIGAGGHFCPVARSLGANVGRAETAIYAQETEFRMNKDQAAHCLVATERPELYFCRDLSGYGWCVRKGDYLNVGLGREEPGHLPQLMQSFWSGLVENGRIPGGNPPHFKGHAYLLYDHSPRTLLADRCLLIGDAAGLAYPHSGEGIRPAVESAMLAAASIRDSHGDFSTVALAGYRNRLEARFGKRFNSRSTRRRPYLSATRQAIGRYLLTREPFARHVLLDRFFLHRRLPSLPSPRLGLAA